MLPNMGFCQTIADWMDKVDLIFNYILGITVWFNIFHSLSKIFEYPVFAIIYDLYILGEFSVIYHSMFVICHLTLMF